MIRKPLTLIIAVAVGAAACGKSVDTSTGPTTVDVTKARIRVANATPTAFDIAVGGSVFLGGGAIAYGSSACAVVDPAAPALALLAVGTTTPVAGLTLTLPTLTANTDYQLILYNVGTTPTAAVIPVGAYTSTDTLAQGVRAFNATLAATGAVDAHLIATGGAISTATMKAGNTAIGTASAYFDVRTPNNLLRFARTAAPTTSLTYTAPTTGNFVFNTGITILPKSQTTVVLAPAATGTGVRAFMIGGC